MERLEVILDIMPIGCILLNREFRITRFNPAAEKIFGYRTSEVSGKHPLGLIVPMSSDAALADTFRRIEKGDPATDNIGRNITREGRRIACEWKNAPLYDANGDFSGVLSMCQDVTELKEAEAQIRDQAKLLDLVHDAILVRDLDDRILFWNREAERLYGYAAAEVVRKKSHEILGIDPFSFEVAREYLMQNGSWFGEVIHRRKDGSEVMIESRWTLLHDEEGKPKSVLVINTDVTEKKNLEVQFLRAQRLESIGTLSSGIAHDLNNILAPILMSAPVLRQDISEEAKEMVISTIESSAQRGADIVKQVLTFARGIEGERVLIQPSHIVKDMVQITRETFPRSITVTSRIGAHPASIIGDATQVHQVLLNLCVNARDAMPDGGNLILRCENSELDESYLSAVPGAKPGRYVHLSVKDNGVGIPRSVQEKMFDPFFTTKDVGKGTGLGLSTVIGIVKSHGGFITVDSEPGKGSSFDVYIPAAPETAAAGQGAEQAALPLGNGELVLVVDDEEGIRKVTQTILDRHGYRAVTACDGTEALAVFARQSGEIHVVLTDIMMPFMDGVALVRALKKMTPEVRIIASSGNGEDRRQAELKALNTKGFLTKPYHTEALLVLLDEVLHPRES